MLLRTDANGQPIDHPSNRLGDIYFVQVGGNGLIKIGFSTNLAKRLQALRSGHPTPLKLLGSVPGTIHDEQKWHRDFAYCRRHGEWFRPDQNLRTAIATATLERGWIGSEIEVKSRTIPERKSQNAK